jgi:hypothetical protein
MVYQFFQKRGVKKNTETKTTKNLRAYVFLWQNVRLFNRKNDSTFREKQTIFGKKTDNRHNVLVATFYYPKK